MIFWTETCRFQTEKSFCSMLSKKYSLDTVYVEVGFKWNREISVLLAIYGNIYCKYQIGLTFLRIVVQEELKLQNALFFIVAFDFLVHGSFSGSVFFQLLSTHKLYCLTNPKSPHCCVVAIWESVPQWGDWMTTFRSRPVHEPKKSTHELVGMPTIVKKVKIRQIWEMSPPITIII